VSDWAGFDVAELADAAHATDAEALWRQARAWSLTGALLHAHADRLADWRSGLAARWRGAAATRFLAEVDRLIQVVRTAAEGALTNSGRVQVLAATVTSTQEVVGAASRQYAQAASTGGPDAPAVVRAAHRRALTAMQDLSSTAAATRTGMIPMPEFVPPTSDGALLLASRRPAATSARTAGFSPTRPDPGTTPPSRTGPGGRVVPTGTVPQTRHPVAGPTGAAGGGGARHLARDVIGAAGAAGAAGALGRAPSRFARLSRRTGASPVAGSDPPSRSGAAASTGPASSGGSTSRPGASSGTSGTSSARGSVPWAGVSSSPEDGAPAAPRSGYPSALPVAGAGPAVAARQGALPPLAGSARIEQDRIPFPGHPTKPAPGVLLAGPQWPNHDPGLNVLGLDR
jgi:hypothetical protein